MGLKFTEEVAATLARGFEDPRQRMRELRDLFYGEAAEVVLRDLGELSPRQIQRILQHLKDHI